MVSKYKLSGLDKNYTEGVNYFIKHHEISLELNTEIMAYRLAGKNNIPTPRIMEINRGEHYIVFEKVNWPRLDQILKIYKEDKSYCLELIRLCGYYVSQLHYDSATDREIDYSLQFERLTRLQKDLYCYQNISSETVKKVISQIRSSLNEFRCKQSKSSLIHGDFICQNIFCSENNPEILIFDWENACFSDPIYDLSSFISFLLIMIVKSNLYTIEDLYKIEQVLLESYSKKLPLSEFDMYRYAFFKFLGHHCMYWYYLLIFQEIGFSFFYERTSRFFKGVLDNSELNQLVKEFNKLGFYFKQSSLESIYLLLQRSNLNFLEAFDFPFIKLT